MNIKQEEQLYRTLFEVIRKDRHSVWIRLPAYDMDVAFKVSIYEFPIILREQMKPDYTFFGFANIGLYDPRNLHISGPYEYESMEEIEKRIAETKKRYNL